MASHIYPAMAAQVIRRSRPATPHCRAIDNQHSLTYPVFMTKNITLAIDEDLLQRVRKYAAEHDTTVNAIVRQKLAEVVAPKKRMADALKRMEAIADEAGMEVGPVTWTRDDVYER